jgi:hypothetical protein
MADDWHIPEWVVAAYLPGGRVSGGEYVVRSPLRADNEAGSFKVSLKPGKVGLWTDWATGESGNMQQLVSACEGIGTREADQRLREIAGSGPPDNYTGATVSRTVQREDVRAGGTALVRDKYAAVVDASVPITGTPAAIYLASRGITPHDISDLRAVCMDGLDFYGRQGWHMVGIFRCPVGIGRALHVTPLTEDGRKNGDRRTFGPLADADSGFGIRLGPDSSRVVICEGIESALSGAVLAPGRQPFAAGSAGGMAKWSPPAMVNDVLIMADADTAGINAGERLASRLHFMGIAHEMVCPDVAGQDANDVLMEGINGA